MTAINFLLDNLDFFSGDYPLYSHLSIHYLREDKAKMVYYHPLDYPTFICAFSSPVLCFRACLLGWFIPSTEIVMAIGY